MYSLKPKNLFIEVLGRSPYSVLLFQLKQMCSLWPLVHLTVPNFIGFQEGKQASLAADFSITQFKHLGRLLMVHGRNSYKRSAALSQFVIHRSLCISTMQVGGQPPLRAGARGCPGESEEPACALELVSPPGHMAADRPRIARILPVRRWRPFLGCRIDRSCYNWFAGRKNAELIAEWVLSFPHAEIRAKSRITCCSGALPVLWASG